MNGGDSDRFDGKLQKWRDRKGKGRSMQNQMKRLCLFVLCYGKVTAWKVLFYINTAHEHTRHCHDTINVINATTAPQEREKEG